MDEEKTKTNALVWTEELVAAFWDYTSTHRPQDHFAHQYGERIAKETKRFVPSDSRICDYGCGGGDLIAHLCKLGCCAGVEFAPESRRRANEKNMNTAKFLGVFSPEEVATMSGQFDVVYFVETVEHLLEHQIAPTMERLHNLVRPGGIIVCTTPNNEDLSAQQVFCPVSRVTFHRFQHMRSLNRHSISRLFRSYGFEAVATFETDFSVSGFVTKLRAAMRPLLGIPSPHLVYVGKRLT